MSLYKIQHDGQVDYVEANGFHNAEQAWLAHVRGEPDNADFNDEPDSIEFLSTDAVIRQDQPCQKTNANAGTGVTPACPSSTQPDRNSDTSATTTRPTSTATVFVQPSEPKTSVDDAITTGPTTSMHMVALPESTTGMASVQNANASPSAPPSEPEAVRRARELATARNLGRGGFSNAFVLELLTHIDTLSARLKRAEVLLGQISNDFLGDHFGDYLNIVDAFLAGKEPT